MVEAGRSLAQTAERGRVVPEWHEDSIREQLLGNYQLIYQVTEQGVYVIGLVHGARDLDALWKREGRQRSRN